MPPAPTAPPPAPAAPAAPAPAPAPAPSPAPAPAAPAPAPSPSPRDNPFAALDAKLKHLDESRSGKPVVTPNVPEPTGDEPEPKPTTAAPAAAPTANKPMPKQLREELDRVKTDYAAAQKREVEYKQKLEAAERRGAETDALQKKYEEATKRTSELERELYAQNIEKDPKFIEAHDKPFNKQLAYASSVVKQLQVMDEGVARMATDDDLYEIMQAPAAKAIQLANDKFGNAAQIVLNHVQELQRMWYNRQEALKEHRANIARNHEAAETDRLARETNMRTAWQRLNKELEDGDESYRTPAGDTELEELRQEGLRIYDTKASTAEAGLIKSAHIRQRVAAFGPNQLTIRRLKAEVARLTEENDKIKNPGPGQPKRQAGDAPAKEGDWADDLRSEFTKKGIPLVGGA